LLSGLQISGYLLVAWLCLVGYIVQAQHRLWLYSLAVWSFVAYIAWDQYDVYAFAVFAYVGTAMTTFLCIFQYEVAGGTRDANGNAIPVKKDTSRDGQLRIFDVDGKEQLKGKTTRAIPMGQQPPVTLNRWPDYWDISLLISKPAGVAPDICFDINPPNGKSGHIYVIKLPHEGEKNMCLQLRLGPTWDLGGKMPMGDQHYWGRLSENRVKEEKDDMTNASEVEEQK